MKTKQKTLRPIDVDSHLKYECPDCSAVHWLTLKETQVKGFVMVCECNNVLRPKRIDRIKIVYAKSNKTKKSSPASKESGVDIVDKCATILIEYGFESSEAKNLVKKVTTVSKETDVVKIIKLCLSTFGENQHG